MAALEWTISAGKALVVVLTRTGHGKVHGPKHVVLRNPIVMSEKVTSWQHHREKMLEWIETGVVDKHATSIRTTEERGGNRTEEREC